MTENDYKKLDKVNTPHGVGTVAGVGASSPWNKLVTGRIYVWVVLDAPFRPRHPALYYEPKLWSFCGGWRASDITLLHRHEGAPTE